MMEKLTTLPTPVAAPLNRKSKRPSLAYFLLGAIFSYHLVTSTLPAKVHRACFSKSHSHGAEYTLGSPELDLEYYLANVQCPDQPKPIFPKMAWNMTDSEKSQSIQLFSEAVQIPTESFDDNGEPNEDPRWKPFFDFQEWLKTSFPKANEVAKVEYVNALGIVATFQGSDESLKPLLLMSHYDVTPAPASTFDRWSHPAFSGHNDGTFIWGRGSSDDKTLMVAQWEGITHLLENGFKPRRTLILSHGFDEEEVFARRGQGHIAPFLEERYGKDGLLMVIDEGSGTSDDWYGGAFAMPNMGEKGYMDIKISVGTAGGHSSVPPVHSGIGIMSQIVEGLENNQFDEKLTAKSPLVTSLLCAAKHSPSFPSAYAKLLKSEGPSSWPKLARKFAAEGPKSLALAHTTTAVDVVLGGVKVNALPELVTAMVNFRIDFSESVGSTQDHVAGILAKVAKKNKLKFSAFEGKGDDDKGLGGRFVKVDVLGLPLEPAPRTPSTGGVWELFAGTVKAALPGPKGEERIVTPFASTGNTDCKMYYNLTKHVYRFMGSPNDAGFNAHTVDEKARIDAHYKIVGWIHAIIQNADAYDGEQ